VRTDSAVIEVLKSHGDPLWVNPDLARTIEARPDTRLLLTTRLTVTDLKARQAGRWNQRF